MPETPLFPLSMVRLFNLMTEQTRKSFIRVELENISIKPKWFFEHRLPSETQGSCILNLSSPARMMNRWGERRHDLWQPCPGHFSSRVASCNPKTAFRHEESCLRQDTDFRLSVDFVMEFAVDDVANECWYPTFDMLPCLPYSWIVYVWVERGRENRPLMYRPLNAIIKLPRRWRQGRFEAWEMTRGVKLPVEEIDSDGEDKGAMAKSPLVLGHPMAMLDAPIFCS